MNWILKNKNLPSETSLGEDFAKNKNISQGKSRKTLLVVLFLVFNVLFTPLEMVMSADPPAAPGPDYNLTGTTTDYRYNSGGLATTPIAPAGPVNPNTAWSTNTPGKTLTEEKNGTDKTCGVNLSCHFTMLLVGVFNLTGFIFAIAATLFAWVVEPANISGTNGMLNKQAVKDVWIMVRDTLNMTFILILLFSAFCTIFQVEKWNLKKVWLNILINALLVNFSYPIARFFIDVSNVAFYYFINNLFSSNGQVLVTGSSIFASFGAVSSLGDVVKPYNYDQFSTAYLIAMIVVAFIIGMTLLIIAGLFVVRLVALTMLVMFSPIGFVGYIFPSTKSYADDWWKKLFSYSFFAPIMIFIMAIALRIAEALRADNINSMISNASTNSSAGQANWIANSAFFMIPVIILWFGIGVAKSMGIEGADKVVGAVKKGGKWLANAPGKYSGIYGATKKATDDFNKKGKLFGKKIPLMGSEGREAREAAMSAFVTGGTKGYKDARRNVEDKKVAEQMKEYKDRNYTSDQIAKDLGSGSKTTQMAAVRALMSEKGALGADPNRMVAALNIAGGDMALRNKIIDSADNFAGNDTFTAAHLNSVLSSATAGLGASDPTRKAIEGKIKGKVKKENVKKLIDYEVAHLGKSVTNAYRDNLESLNAEDFGKQNGLHENIGTDANLQHYILNHVAADAGFHQEVFKNMKKGNRTRYISEGLHP